MPPDPVTITTPHGEVALPWVADVFNPVPTVVSAAGCANLRDANLSYANLRDADLDGANLSYAIGVTVKEVGS
jgi:hypothetical protein